MKAGKLDRRIRIERATTAQDAGSGQEIETWGVLAEVWASKRDVSDAERFAAAEVAASISTRFQIRWSEQVRDVSPLDRIVYDGKTYGIVAVKELGRREGLELSAIARADL